MKGVARESFQAPDVWVIGPSLLHSACSRVDWYGMLRECLHLSCVDISLRDCRPFPVPSALCDSFIFLLLANKLG